MRSRNIVVIDDSEDDIELYKRLLNKIFPNVNVLDFTSSEKALEVFSNGSQEYECVLLDYSMPGYSGLDFLNLLKSKEISMKGPVIILTGHGDENIAVKFMKYGAEQYVTKNNLEENQLRYAIMEAQRAFSEKKKEQTLQRERISFVYTLAHDLQNPVKRIESYASLAKRFSGEQDKVDKYLSLVVEDTKFISEFINTLLNYTEMGRSSFPKEKISLKEALEKSVDLLSVKISETNAVINLQDDYPEVLGAKIPLVQMFQNIINNSLKYCKGVPKVDVFSRIQDKNLCVSIKDNGVGIPKELANQIFEPFSRLSPDYDVGYGLGLTIVKTIADQHDALITLEHPEEGGVQFNINFPLIK